MKRKGRISKTHLETKIKIKDKDGERKQLSGFVWSIFGLLISQVVSSLMVFSQTYLHFPIHYTY